MRAGAAPLPDQSHTTQYDKGEGNEQNGRAERHGEDQCELRCAAPNTASAPRATRLRPTPIKTVVGGSRCGGHERTEHRRRRHLPRPGQRPDGEDERRQEAAGGRDQKR